MLRVRSALLAILCLLFVASWPGAVLRPLLLELTAPPLPANLEHREGVLDVVVRASASEPSVGAPLAGVRVRAFSILDQRAHAAGEVLTDAGGRATLRDLPLAEHWIVAEAPGRARASQMVVVEAEPRRLDLELGPEHKLDVEVKSEDGALVSAELEVRGSDPFPVGARTNEAGRAHVGRLGEGPYTVTVRAPGFEEITRRQVPEGEHVVITLGRKGALFVKVVGESGAPVAGAHVQIASPVLWPARTAETTEGGAVRIGGLDAGTYALRAALGGRVSPVEIGVAVGRGEERPVELRLGPGVVVTARVVDAATDDGIAQARVTLVEGGLSSFPFEGVADKAGRVTLGPMAPGEATLAARAEGYVARGAVHVDPATRGEVRLTLLRGGTLVGRIVDARGYAVDGATIRVVGTDLDGLPIDEDPVRSSFREAHFTAALAGPAPLVPAGELGVMPGPVPGIPHGIGAGGAGLGASGAAFAASGPPLAHAVAEPWVSGRDGSFTARPVTPGRVRALVTHPQYVEAMSEVVALAPDEEAEVRVVLHRGGDLEGKVVDVRGNPVGGAHVTLLATHGSLERVTRTGTDGSFAFAAVPDAVTLLVSRDEDVTQVAARAEVTVSEGARRTVQITLPEARPALAVRVTGERGAPVDAAQISAVSLDAAEALRVTAFTDARGEAQIASGKGLVLRVEVRAPGRAARIVTTTPEMATLTVELTAAEALSGEVWANRREPVEGAEVVVQTETGARRARTDKSGAFTVGDLSPGPARLRVHANGRAPLARDVVIEDRGGRRATDVGKLQLPEEGTVEGVVVDGRGDPVPGARVAENAVPTYLPVGALPHGMAVTDAKGRFRLAELAEGNLALEAYAPELGRARAVGVRVLAGRTTLGVKIVLTQTEAPSREPPAAGGVAVTLGETAAGIDEPEVVIAAVSENSEAERAGLVAGDVVVEVAGARVSTMEEARSRLSGPVHDDVVVKVRRAERTLTLRVPREAVRR